MVLLGIMNYLGGGPGGRKWGYYRCVLEGDMGPWTFPSLHSGCQQHDHLSSAMSSPVCLKQVHQVTKTETTETSESVSQITLFSFRFFSVLQQWWSSPVWHHFITYLPMCLCELYATTPNGVRINKPKTGKSLVLINMPSYFYTIRKGSKIIMLSEW